jgi:5-methylcytosine-specific restriction endonuclease McrA
MSNREYNDGEWTEARFRAFIISALRAYMKRFPPKWKALKAASIGRIINKRSGRLAEHYKCAGCTDNFVARDVQVDHIEPVVSPQEGFQDWWTYMNRLYCEAENLQVLCKPCHKQKTAEERKERVKNK